MINIIEKVNCCGCHACYNICLKNAIEMVEDEYGFKYPKINKEKCINCGLCEKVCPIINKPKHDNKDCKVYGAFNNNEEERMQSSSGGIFSLIAKEVINKDGIVFGASFDDKFGVHHIEINKHTELKKLRTSKYVQSSIEDTYKKAREYLQNDKLVLFTGTPCQINGLYSYLQKNYDNLITQDIICHGVPSPKVWQRYLDYRKNKNKMKFSKINFREKEPFGWKLYSLSINNEYNQIHGKDAYMISFLDNMSLRDSCYNCKFKDKERISDITLADFWGIENIMPEMNDNKGTSLVIVNTKKGQELLENIKGQITIKECNFDDAIKYNSAMTQSAPKHKKREQFLKEIFIKEDFEKITKKYEIKASLFGRFKKKIKRILLKIKK